MGGIIFAGKKATGRILQKPKALLKLGGPLTGFEFRLPCWISLQPRSQIVVTAVDGLQDTVKEIMDMQGFEINIQTETGNWDIRTIHRLFHKPVKAMDDIRDLLMLFRDQKESIEAVDEEGVLAAAGISHIVLHSVNIDPMPEKPHGYSIALGAYSELDPETTIIDLMPETGKFEGGGTLV